MSKYSTTFAALVLAAAMTMLPAAHLAALDLGLEDLTTGISVTSSTSLLIPNADGFVSPLNPGNVFGIIPVANTSSTLVAIEHSTPDDLFTFWGSATLGLGSIEPASIDVRRLSYLRYFGDLRMTLGRHSLMTGYGYAWNPMDLVSPFKDLNDPHAEQDGLDAVSLLWDSGHDISLEGYALIIPSETTTWPLDLHRLGFGGEFVWYLPDSGIEMRAAALAGPLFLDPAPTDLQLAFGAGIYGDLAGIGLYAEGAIRSQSRIPEISPLGTAEAGAAWPLSLLLGTEYFFESGLSLVGEYMYHGEGFSIESREHFADAVLLDPGLLTYFRPGLFARHYIMVTLLYPLYDLGAESMLTLLVSPDSGAIMVNPILSWYISDSITLQAGYTGMVSLPELLASDPSFAGSDEAALSPVNHLITVTLKADL